MYNKEILFIKHIVMIKSVVSVFTNTEIRKKIIATLLLVLVYKFLSVITIPGVDASQLKSVLDNNA